MGMTAKFDLKKVTTPLLLHMLGRELRFPRVFLLMRKLTLNRFKKTIDPRFPRAACSFIWELRPPLTQQHHA